MALKPCRECGKQVSTDAKTCPHCGKKNPTQAKVSTLAGCLIMVIAFGVVAAIAGGGSGAPSSAPASGTNSAPDPADVGRFAIDKTKDLLREHAKDAESVKFRATTAHRHQKDGRDSYLVCGAFNAKNSFGAYVGYKQFVSGGSLESIIIEDADGMTPAIFKGVWDQACSSGQVASTPADK